MDDRGRIVQLTRYRDNIYIKVIDQKLKHVVSNEVVKGSSGWKTGRGWKFTADIVPELSNTIKVRGLKSASFNYIQEL